MKFNIIVLLIAAALAFSIPAYADTGTGTVRLQIEDNSTGAILNDATIMIYDLSGNLVLSKDTVGGAASYVNLVFANMTAGAYFAHADVKGYSKGIGAFNITPGSDFMYSIKLVKQDASNFYVSLDSLNPIVQTVSPTQTVNGNFAYTVWNANACSGGCDCIDQIVVGVNNEPKYCLNVGIPYCYPGKSGDSSFSFSAPSASGVYLVDYVMSETYNCNDAYTAYRNTAPSQRKIAGGIVVSVPQTNTTSSCTDSDGGKEPYVSGSVTGLIRDTDTNISTLNDTCYKADIITSGIPSGGVFVDACGANDLCYVEERDCSIYSSSLNVITTYDIRCPNGCSSGACVPAANSLSLQERINRVFDYYKNKSSSGVNVTWDYIHNNIQSVIHSNNISDIANPLFNTDVINVGDTIELPLRSIYPNNNIETTPLPPPTMPSRIATITVSPETDKPVVIPSGSIANNTAYVCDGCSKDGTCYPLGYRMSGEYCTPGKSFASQLSSDAPCENNFECGSNVCASGKCISGDLLQMILGWFKRLFGIA